VVVVTPADHVGTAVAVALADQETSVVGPAPVPHCAQTLGPVAPGVHPGTTWVVRSEGARGETVTVRVCVLGVQSPPWAGQVMVLVRV
jgi:hypothetical protein